jgi:hypothetical protein
MQAKAKTEVIRSVNNDLPSLGHNDLVDPPPICANQTGCQATDWDTFCLSDEVLRNQDGIFTPKVPTQSLPLRYTIPTLSPPYTLEVGRTIPTPSPRHPYPIPTLPP